MKKSLLTVLVGLTLASPVGLAAASASPAAPRASAQVAAPRAAVTSAHATSIEVKEARTDAQFCLGLDTDNKHLCVLGGTPGQGCKQIFQITPLIAYYRCGHIDKPPTPGGCLNLEGDHVFTCLGRSKPDGACKQTFALLFIHRYYCFERTSGGGGLLPDHFRR